MTYTRKTEFGIWRIEEDPKRNWVVLKLQREMERWRVVNIFYTVAGAAAAVGCGETSDAGWDQLTHESADFALDRWELHSRSDPRQSAA